MQHLFVEGTGIKSGTFFFVFIGAAIFSLRLGWPQAGPSFISL